MLFELRTILTGNSSGLVDSLSRAVAQRSLGEIHRRLSHTAKHMNVAEARGYVRARARRVVRRHMVHVTSEQGRLSMPVQKAVFSMGLERAVHLAVRDLLTVPQAQFRIRVAG